MCSVVCFHVCSFVACAFGFGVAVADVTEETARSVGRFADIAGAYVRADISITHPNDELERRRVGTRCDLGLSKHNSAQLGQVQGALRCS